MKTLPAPPTRPGRPGRPGRQRLHRPAIRNAVALFLVSVGVTVFGLGLTLGASSATARPYGLQPVKLAGGDATVARWNPCQKAIVWRTNFSGLRAAQRPAMLRQLRTAFARLSAADGMTYRYAGNTPFVPRQENLVQQPADIVVATVEPASTDFDFTDNSLGYGGVLWATWYGDSGEGAVVVRGYVILIPSGIAKLKSGFGAGKTQGDLIYHELGHTTGLVHVTDRNEQMYPVLTPDAPSGYARGDLTGLAALGARRGCITVPARVDIKDYS